MSSLLNASLNLKYDTSACESIPSIFVQTPTTYEVLSQFSQTLFVFVN
jgi:hypothetical protein